MLNEAIQKSGERRTSARSPLFMLVNITGGNAGVDQLWAWDIGLGGIQARSRKTIFPGTFVDLKFSLPGTPDAMSVGGQVTSIDEAPEGGLSLGIKFCRPSRRLRMSIYRFLDSRRVLWDETVVSPAPVAVAVADAGLNVQSIERPFEGLLLESFHSMREKEMGGVAALKSHPSRDLWILGRLLGRKEVAVAQAA